MDREESLEDMLDKLKVEAKPWDIATPLENDLMEAFRVDEQVDIIYAALVTEGLDESDLRRYMKKVDGICKTIEKEVPNIRKLSHRERGRVIFDKVLERYIGKSGQYKLTETLDAGTGNCHSLSALVGGIMQRFGLNVIFREYLGPDDSHVNIGLICEDEEGKPIITVDAAGRAYDDTCFDEYLKSGYNLRFSSNYDLRFLCAANLGWKAYEEYRKNMPGDFFKLLQMYLMSYELVPDRSTVLYHIAGMLVNIKISQIKTPIEPDVEFIVGLLEKAVEIRPEYRAATDVLSMVKSCWG